MPIPDNTTRLLHIMAVIITGLGKFVFVDWLELKLYYIVAAVLFWVGFVVYHYRKDDQYLVAWGLSLENFGAVWQQLWPLGLLAVLAFVGIGYWRGAMVVNWHILPVLLLYPIWGTIQQFIIVGLIAGNLQEMEGWSLPNWVIVLVTSVVFSVVHYPSQLLMIGTFMLCLVYATIYLKARNVLVLGLFHGWLGGLFFFLVLGRDAWAEVFAGM